MLEAGLLMVAVLGAAWGAVLVHEGGHYLLGRLLAVPADSIRVRLERPPHVALREGERWLSPDDPGYVATFARHRSSAAAAWLFVAGGFIGETVVVLLLAWLSAGVGTLSLVLVGASTAVLLLYLVSDPTSRCRSGGAGPTATSPRCAGGERGGDGARAGDAGRGGPAAGRVAVSVAVGRSELGRRGQRPGRCASLVQDLNLVLTTRTIVSAHPCAAILALQHYPRDMDRPGRRC